MSASPEHLAGVRVVEEIQAAFPKEAAEIDASLARDCYEDAPHAWVERFSQLTTDAIKRGEDSKALAHLNLLSRLVARGDELTRRCIDVAYVESLMWDIKDEKLKKNGWKLIPVNLRSLYVQMWGESPFMKGVK